MKNKRGFTLIELLSVIVILAVIALIVVPVILNIVNKTNKSAFKDTAYSLVSAGELYFSERQLELDGMSEDKIFNLPNDANTPEGIEIKGQIPNGTITINTEGKIALAITNGRYCITKTYDEMEVTITENIKNCVIPVQITGITVTSPTELSLTVGETSMIEANVEPNNATQTKLNYTSSNKKVVTVSETGVITAVAPGNATITISTTDGAEISTTISVSVIRLVQSITLDKESVTVGVGEDFNEKVNATVLPSNASTKTLTWTSADPAIATVSSGTITGVSLGTTTVTATTTDGSNISKTVSVTVSEPYTNGIMQSVDNCINEGTCTAGTTVRVAVNSKEAYRFHVIKDDSNMLTLIMNKTLSAGYVDWINEYDYKTENNKDEVPDTCSSTACTDEGPITAISNLDKKTTNSWTNITTKEYTYSGLANDGTTRKYEDITRTMRARMITYSEVKALGCTTSSGSCPSWIYEGQGHWTSTADSSKSNSAWAVDKLGKLTTGYGVGFDHTRGIRPVIELSK